MSGNDSMVFNRRDINSENDDVWDDTALIKMYDKTKAMIYDKMQNSGASSKASSAQPQTVNEAARSWQVGEHCMAPFAEDGKYYPAKITKLLDKNKTCEVVYTEYDTKAIVKLADLLSGHKRAHPSPTTEASAQSPVLKKMCVQAETTNPINFYEDTVLEDIELFSHTQKPEFVPPTNNTEPIHAESSNCPNFYEDTVPDDIKLFSSTQKPELYPKIMKSQPQIVVSKQKTSYYVSHSAENIRLLAKTSTFQAKIYCLKNKPILPKLHNFMPIPSGSVANLGPDTVNGLKQKICAINLYSDAIHERLGKTPQTHGYSLDLSEDDVEYAAEDNAQTQQVVEVPELCPPPPPNLFGQIAQAGNDKEALTNMLMSWYMSGYHTGYFQGMQQGKKKQGGGT